MNLTELKSNKGARHRKKRLGRGNGSGKGTYSGRGMKGQKARSGGNVRPGFEGGQTPFIQKMPKYRGFKNPNRTEYQIINLKDLEKFEDGATVNAETLKEKGMIAKKNLPVKVLGDGELTKKLTVNADKISKSAAEKIKKAGGSSESKKSAEKNNE
jgi:large subunit ribosomal protein L15